MNELKKELEVRRAAMDTKATDFRVKRDEWNSPVFKCIYPEMSGTYVQDWIHTHCGGAELIINRPDLNPDDICRVCYDFSQDCGCCMNCGELGEECRCITLVDQDFTEVLPQRSLNYNFFLYILSCSISVPIASFILHPKLRLSYICGLSLGMSISLWRRMLSYPRL